MNTNQIFSQRNLQTRKHYKTLLEWYRHVITPDPELASLLDSLPGKKIVLTNGSRTHAHNSILALGLSSCMCGQIDATSMNTIPTANRGKLKPYPFMYALTVRHMNRRFNHSIKKYIFYDDLVENLIVPKKMGWTTVYIGNTVTNRNKDPFIDYCFPNIKSALYFWKRNR
jgi:putative hydrolase of the HAD superfamily